jgi:hypothetical protein
MDSMLSTEIIRKDDDNLIIWVHFDGDTSRFSDQVRFACRELMNLEIDFIWDAQVPTPDGKFFMKKQVPDPKMRVFVEEGDDLSRIVWLAWEQEKK